MGPGFFGGLDVTVGSGTNVSDSPGSSGPPPASGAWRPGDHPGRRRFVTAFEDSPLVLEAGGELSPVEVAYETWGKLDATGGNVVLVAHALTGDSHCAGPAGPGHRHRGWWNPVIGPGRPIDTDRFFVVCANVLGGCQGTTGPSSLAADGRPYARRFPRITIRDQVAVEAAVPTPSASTGGWPWRGPPWAACGPWSGRWACPTGSSASS